MKQEESHDFNGAVADVLFFGFVLDGVDVCGIKAVNWWDGDGDFLSLPAGMLNSMLSNPGMSNAMVAP